MKPLNKYLYLVPGAALMFLALWGIFLLIFPFFIKHDSCVLGLPSVTKETLRFFVIVLSKITPFIYLYLSLVYLYIAGKPEKDNKLTRISLILSVFILILSFSSYFPVPFLGYIMMFIFYSSPGYFVWMLIPILAFILLIIGDFNKYYLLGCILFALAILGAAIFIDSSSDCIEEKKANETFSMSSTDEKSCEDLTQGDFKTSCYMTIAVNTNNTKICDGLVDDRIGPYSKQRCYSNVAWQNGSIATCDFLKNDPPLFDSCVNGAISKLKATNISSCDIVANKDSYQLCIVKVAENTADPKICNLITIDNVYKTNYYRCLAGIAYKTHNCEVLSFDKEEGGYYQTCLSRKGY